MIYALHGAVGMHQDWQSLQGKIPTGLRAVNLWRFLQCCPMSMPEFGAALNGENTQDDSVLLGYSMGGRLALHSLLDNKAKWKKAIIVSAHTGLTTQKLQSERLKIDAEWSAKALIGKWEDFLEQWNQQAVLPEAPMPDRRLLRPYKQEIARSFIDWSTGAQDDLLPRLKEINIPVLWITGEEDQKFTEVAKAAVQELPNGEHHIIPNAGHRIPWENPEAFSDILNSWLEE